MKNTRIQGFSFIEILIIITIIALISVVAYTSFGVRKENTVNTKIQSEISTLSNALLSYKQENSILPQPQWNRNFFAEDTSYIHDYEDDETFWVHGFITHNTLAKKYIDIIPVDPRTGSFYAYGKTKWDNQESEMYEIAWVTFNWDKYRSFVTGDYTAENGPFNLIREYNGPNFVYNKSQNNYPYNPLERILTAKIDDFSGNILINNSSYSSEEILSYELKSWDTIEVEQNAIAELYYSDGSRSILWDTSRPTLLTLSKMEFSQENNLITDIKLVLESWMIWNKAASLDEESGFEIYTTDSTAAVRWTIFWVQKNETNSTIIIKKWTVAVNQIDRSAVRNTQTLKTYIKNNDTIPHYPIDMHHWLIEFDSNTQESLIKVENNDTEKWIIISMDNILEYTWSLDYIPFDVKDEILNNYPIINSNIQVKLNSYYYKAPSASITLDITEKVFQNVDFLLINGRDVLNINKNTPYTQSWRIITYTFDENSWNIEEASYNIDDYITGADTSNIIINSVWSDNIDDFSNIDQIEELNNRWLWWEDSFDPTQAKEAKSLLNFISKSHASNQIDLFEYITSKLNLEEEQITIQLWKIAHNWKIRLTNKISLTIINEKSYENKNKQDKKITEDDIIKEKETNIVKERWVTECDGFLFTNINNQNKCADADNDLVTDNWNLFAFAPYDNAGDIMLYMSWWNNEPKTNKVVKYKNWWDDSNWKYRHNIWAWWDAYENDNLPDYCLNNNQNFYKHNSFCSVSSINWIFIDDWWNKSDDLNAGWGNEPSSSNDGNDFIKYLNVDLSWDYIFEINVKGSSLNQLNPLQFFKNHTLLSIEWKNFSLKKNALNWDIFFYKENEDLLCWSNQSNCNQLTWLSDDGFYSIFIWKNSLKIQNTNINTIYAEQNLSSSSNAWFYVWSNQQKTRQWDDIINYVKIYKK